MLPDLWPSPLSKAFKNPGKMQRKCESTILTSVTNVRHTVVSLREETAEFDTICEEGPLGGSPENKPRPEGKGRWGETAASSSLGPQEGFHAWGLKAGPCGLGEEDGRD